MTVELPDRRPDLAACGDAWSVLSVKKLNARGYDISLD